MKILHILDHYKPHFSGYVFRTSYILKYQKELGLEPVVVTSPKHGITKETVEDIDNITVYRTVQNGFGNIPFVKESRLMKALQKRIEEVIREQKPDIIHAHSPSLNGIPAVRAGRKFGIPVVYEVRALWEDAAVDHGTFQESSLKYGISRFIETNLFKKVNAISTICDGLKNEIMSRGIARSKITVIPNSVDTNAFFPVGYDEEIACRYGLKNKKVYGFIGSFYHYEGIDLLIDAFSIMLKRDKNIILLLVGEGPEYLKLQDKVKEMNLEGTAIFVGRVPHEQIKRYYSVIDTLVYPRKKMRLTELVTPLKPLEAMAMGKVVVGSNVGGIKELITHNQNGLLFKAGSVDSLYTLLDGLNQYTKNINEIVINAQETIRKKYTWQSAVGRYIPLYTNLIKKQIF